MKIEIDKRLQRIYALLGMIVQTNIQSTLKFTQEENSVRMSFDKDISQEAVENAAHAAIEIVSNLPDHLRKYLRANRRPVLKLERFEKKSKEFNVLKDLANLEKHGEHNRKRGRTGLLPTITNIHRGMRLEPKPEGSRGVYLLKLPENTFTHEEGDYLQVIIDGDIKDKDGNILYKLPELLNTVLNQLENIYKFPDC